MAMDTNSRSNPQQLQAAMTVGRGHLARHEGGQDACAIRRGTTREGRSFHVGVVADGCGSAAHSVVGAKLLVAAAARETATLLAAGVSTAGLVEPVLAACRRALLGVVAAVAAGEESTRPFVESHLLATLLVLATDGDTTTVFGRGDGLVVFGDQVLVLDEGGAPTYLAYDLFAPPTAPFVHTVEADQRVLIASDGLAEDHALEAFGHRGRGLSRWLNVLAESAPLTDDATVIVAENDSLPRAWPTDEGGFA
jgi:hypothetical protein